MADTFQIYSNRSGTIVDEGHADTFDNALIRYFIVPSQWAKIMVKSPGAVCVKAYGFVDPVAHLKQLNHIVSTTLGGASVRHEVYWNVQGSLNHVLHDSYEHAVAHTEDVGAQWAHIVVRSSDNEVVKEYGNAGVVEGLKRVAHCPFPG